MANLCVILAINFLKYCGVSNGEIRSCYYTVTNGQTVAKSLPTHSTELTGQLVDPSMIVVAT